MRFGQGGWFPKGRGDGPSVVRRGVVMLFVLLGAVGCGTTAQGGSYATVAAGTPCTSAGATVCGFSGALSAAVECTGGIWQVAAVCAAGSYCVQTNGGPQCASSAGTADAYPVPDKSIFDKVQVVSAFPAYVDAPNKTVTRVCGAPLAASEPVLEANGVELTVNLVSWNLKATSPKCDGDVDLGIRDGDLIENILVTTDPALQTIAPGNFELDLGCYEPRVGLQDPAICSTSAGGAGGTGKAVKYKAYSPGRCDPTMLSTWQNVAILVDHTGSTDGFVYTDTGNCTTATNFIEDLPGKWTPDSFPECSSDRYSVLVDGAQQLIETLNPMDRVLTMYYDESNDGVRVACTDDLRCQYIDGTDNEVTTKACISNADCKDLVDPDGNKGNYQCAADPSFANDSFAKLSQPEQMNKCFGSTEELKAQNRLGLEERIREAATGRSPVYEALNTAYTFLRDKDLGAGAPRHIVLLTDGPDSCTYSDLFQFVDPKVGKGGNCRKQCAMITTDYKSLLQVMHDDKFPVRLHVIQIESKTHPQPDAYLQDLACRSEGTYQFINTLDMNTKDPTPFQDAMSRSIAMVRYTLSGNWRVGFADDRFKDGSVKKGAITAMRGKMTMQSKVFSSLKEVFKSDKDWQFTQDGSRDRRMIFHLSCANDADCGGSDPCGANHCSPAGECVATPSPDLLPCGPDGKGKCCSGVCKADGNCVGVCKG